MRSTLRTAHPGPLRSTPATIAAPAGEHRPWVLGGVGHGQDGRMRIRARSVFERIVYHCHCVDPADPGRPTLEVDALLRDGDADGPLL